MSRGPFPHSGRLRKVVVGYMSHRAIMDPASNMLHRLGLMQMRHRADLFGSGAPSSQPRGAPGRGQGDGLFMLG